MKVDTEGGFCGSLYHSSNVWELHFTVKSWNCTFMYDKDKFVEFSRDFDINLIRIFFEVNTVGEICNNVF